MAKLEIPSIVVQSGSHTAPAMDHSAKKSQWSLSTQSTFEDDADPLLSSVPSGEVDHPPPIQPNEKDNDSKPEVPSNNNNVLPRMRSKSNLKLLKRSHAIKESTSPPPDISLSPVDSPTLPTSATEFPSQPTSNNNNNNDVCTINNNGLSARPSIKREGSNQSTDSNWSSSISRGNSIELQYSDQSGIDIEQFIIDTLNKNTKDRIFLLRVESELVSLAKDPRKNSHKFGAMSSYQRMLVHRVAHYFGMEHNVDSTGHMVIVNKGKLTRLPENRFHDFIRGELLLSEEPRKSILKRDSASFEDTVSLKSSDRHSGDAPRRSKSFEEREEEYEKARRRIFHQEHGDHNQEDCEDELRWSQLSSPWERTESSTDSTKLHPSSHRPSRLTKVESYESKDTLRANSLRSSVSKSYSFGGYDQNSPNSRVLTKQDSGSSVSSRVSPSSSGYKSQSQRSDTTMSATPSPTATPHLTTQLSSQSEALLSPDIEQETVMWAVTNMASVPIGSILINPQTGQPVKNEDGSVYHYDPENPPKLNFNAEPSSLPIRQSDENCEKNSSSGPGSSRRREQDTSEVRESCANSTPIPPTVDAPPSYHQEDSSHQQTENGIPQESRTGNHYHTMPPPAPSAPLPHANPHIAYTNPVMYSPAAVPYGVVMQPPPAGDGYSTQPSNTQMIFSIPPAQASQPYGPAPAAPTAVPYERLNVMGTAGTAAQTVPLYFTPTNTTAPQPLAPGSRYPCSYAQYPTPPHSEPVRPATEFNYLQLPLHANFSRCPSQQVGGTPSYCPGNGGSGGSMMGLVMSPTHAQPTRPYHHRLPTSPSNTQNGYTQYPMYSNGYPAMPGCYQHYPTTNIPAQVPLAPVMRPALQINMNNNPPVRTIHAPSYNHGAARSPVVRDTSTSEPRPHTSSPIRYTAAAAAAQHPPPIPVYRFTYPANDLILLNTTRAPFPSPATANRGPSVSNNHFRRPRPRPVGPSNNGRPVFAASQQQAALATAIEAAGLGLHTGGKQAL